MGLIQILALVGVQKLAAANSNTATRHILGSSMFITTSLAEAISLRFKDVLEFHPTKEAFIGALGRFTVGSLEELKNLHMHDFGIFLELEPDQEEKQLLEANIQTALAQKSIFLEDAIDIREVNNTKLANQLLKFRRIKKQQTDQAQAQAASVAQLKHKDKRRLLLNKQKRKQNKLKQNLKFKFLMLKTSCLLRKWRLKLEQKEN